MRLHAVTGKYAPDPATDRFTRKGSIDSMETVLFCQIRVKSQDSRIVISVDRSVELRIHTRVKGVYIARQINADIRFGKHPAEILSPSTVNVIEKLVEIPVTDDDSPTVFHRQYEICEKCIWITCYGKYCLKEDLLGRSAHRRRCRSISSWAKLLSVSFGQMQFMEEEIYRSNVYRISSFFIQTGDQ